MPVKECQYNKKKGFKYGDSGKCYTDGTSEENRKLAHKQGVAIKISQGKIKVTSMTKLEKEILEIVTNTFKDDFTFEQVVNSLEGNLDEFVNPTQIYAILESLIKEGKIDGKGKEKYSLIEALTKDREYGISSIVSNIVMIAIGKKIPMPGPKKRPKYLTDKADRLWPEFWKSYGKNVRAVKDPERRWATAVAIFRNYCLKRNVAIFKDSAAFMNQETSEYMKNRLDKNREKLVNKTKVVLKKLRTSGIGNSILKERISEVFKSPKGWTIESVVPINLVKGLHLKDTAVRAYFKNFGFTPGRDRMILTMGAHNIYLYSTNKPERLDLIKSLNFTDQHIRMMVGLSEEDMKNQKKVIRGY